MRFFAQYAKENSTLRLWFTRLFACLLIVISACRIGKKNRASFRPFYLFVGNVKVRRFSGNRVIEKLFYINV